MKRRTPSSIDRLPEKVRESIDNWLRDPGLTQTEAAARTNALLEEMERSERVSLRAVSRYDRRLRDADEAVLPPSSLRGLAEACAKLSLSEWLRLQEMMLEIFERLEEEGEEGR